MRQFMNALLAGGVAVAAAGQALADDHVLLTEMVVTPTAGEFIEIGNPTDNPIDLSNYYLSDDDDYALLPGQFGLGPTPVIDPDFDFIVQFPPGSQILAGEVQVIAFDGAGFLTEYGVAADYEILGTDAGVPDMIDPAPGVPLLGASAGLTNSGENVVLFSWDGLSDLVQDVDMVNIGTPSGGNDIGDKTGIAVDGPDADAATSVYLADAFTMPQQSGDPAFGFSTKRIQLESGFETAAGGNGITGHDETSEDISITWDSLFTAPDPGDSDVISNPPDGPLLAVSKTGIGFATAGAQITYTIVVSNIGPNAAADVVITDTLPAGATFVSETSPGDVSLDATVPDVVWSTASVDSLEEFTIELTVQTSAAGTYTNTVAVTTSSVDDPADNMASVITEVEPVGTDPGDLFVSEVRIKQTGADDDEFFELRGTPGTSLDGLHYVVIGGNGSVFDGAIEEVISLSGLSIPADGHFLGAEDSLTIPASVDLELPAFTMNFNDFPNKTHLLVVNFVGSDGMDIDTDDDGVIDVIAWTSVIDGVGMIETDSLDFSYAPKLGLEDVGPDGDFTPSGAYRCDPCGDWTQLPFGDTLTDTPGTANPACPEPCGGGGCYGDTNGDNVVNVDDLVNVILDWGTDGSLNGGDIDGSGLVDVDDLVDVILAFGVPCP